MRKWALMLLVLSTVAVAQNPPLRACKKIGVDNCLCLFCETTTGNGYCSCTPSNACTDMGCPDGYSTLKQSGDCTNPPGCGRVSAKESLALALKKWASPDYVWLKSDFWHILRKDYPDVARGVELIQDALNDRRVTACAWQKERVISLEGQPHHPLVALYQNGELSITRMNSDAGKLTDDSEAPAYYFALKAHNWTLWLKGTIVAEGSY